MTIDSDWESSPSKFESLPALLDARAQEKKDKTFAKFPEKELSFADLAQRSKALAGGLATLGIEQDDRICVMMYNRPEFVELFFAVSRLGAVFVPLNVSLQGEDLEYALSDADPVAVVLGSDCRDAYEEVQKDIDIKHELLVNPDNGVDNFRTLSSYYDSAVEYPVPQLTQASTASIIYTSGTTGLPKGVVLPHGSYLTVGTELAERVIQPTDEDTLYMSQPLFHIFAQQVMMEALVAGVSFAMERWFSKSKFWDRVRKYDATIIHFSSAISDILYEDTECKSNPVRIAYGAISDDIQRPFGEKFGCQVVPLYGLTECGGIALSGTVDDPCLGSLGISTRYAEVTLVDDDDNPVPPEEKGDIVIRPTKPNAMFHGYFQKPERTVEATKNQWLHTGDIGRKSEDGQMHFVSRKSHFLRRKGENVSVYEVERILKKHPGVAETIVVGVDASIGGEEILAVVKPASDEDINEVDLIEFCEGRLAYFKIPRYILFVEEFPRTETKGTIERYRFDKEIADEAWDLEENEYELSR